MSAIHYYAEDLGGGRGQLRSDVVIDGRIVESIDVGSPAPLATVQRFEETIHLPDPKSKGDE